MTREEAKRYVEKEMCRDCGIYLGGGRSCPADCQVIEAINALEQEPILDKIRAEIEQVAFKDVSGSKYIFVNRVNQIIDKYKAKVESQESEET